MKLKLNPEPTFKAKVGIPLHGGGTADVEFTFKHRTREQMLAWVEDKREASDAETVLDVATGWDLEDEFSGENVKQLCSNYMGAGFAIVDTYLKELRGARQGN